MEKAKRNANFAYLSNPAIDFDDLLHTLMVKLGLATVDEELSKTKAMHRLNAVVVGEFEKEKNTVIIVDEAQYLDAKTLEGLRLLSNLETRKDKLIQIIISGQPELATPLGQKKLVQLAQRIGLRCQTKPLTEKETHEYIEHRLKVAGYKGPQLFANKATRMIWAHSEGIPRTMNIICDNALLTAYSRDTKRIDASTVQEVIKDLNSVRLNDLEPQKEQIREPAEGQHRQSSDRRGAIQDHLTGFSAAKKGLRDEGKEKRLSLAWTAVIAAVAIIMNIVIFYVLTGNLEDLQGELSLKLGSLKDKIHYQSESKNAQSDEVPRAMLQGSDTNDKNKIDSKEDSSHAKKIPHPALDRSRNPPPLGVVMSIG
jgi:type II secretory pathway predicted ATPase ExeA